MNRLSYYVILYLFSIPAISADSNPFLSFAYDSVCIYEFEWRTKNGMFLSIIDKEGKIVSSVKKTTKLNKKEGKKLSKLLGDSSSYGNEVGACFEPHLGIVYYKDGKIAAHVSVCLMCNQLKSSIHIPAQQQGVEELEGEKFFLRQGMSKSFRKYLDNLLRKFGYSYTIQKGSIFD